MNTNMFKYVLAIIFLLANRTYAQCKFDDDPLNVMTLFTTPVTCPSNGTITVQGVTGGGGQYAYEIIEGPVIRIIQSQNIFNALPAGKYTVRITGCNGDIQDLTTNVSSSYVQLAFAWQISVKKVSGLECGTVSDGVYKLVKPASPGGVGPYKIQFSPTLNFSSVPYLPGYDSAVFTGLSQTTNYYVRITDACNNFITFSFLTALSTPVVPLSVPSLSLQRSWPTGDCSGREAVRIHFRDSATNTSYDGRNAFTNKVFWGNHTYPMLRVRMEDVITGELYMDRHLYISRSGLRYSLATETANTAGTGLAAPGTGMMLFSPNPTADYYLNYAFHSPTVPVNARVIVTIFFPGGNHCGTIIPAYSKSYNLTLGRQFPTQPRITSVAPNCNLGGPFLRVNFSQTYVGDTIALIKLTPSYQVLSKKTLATATNNYASIVQNPLIIGDTYRVIIKDSCGRSDSMDIVYNTSTAPSSPPPVTHTSMASFKCPANPNDSIYNIIINALPSPYVLLSISVDGVGATNYTAINNWDGTGQNVYKVLPVLPPGTYTYKVTWLNNCQTGVVNGSITIAPLGDPPSYARDMTLSFISPPAIACSTNAYRYINVNGFIKNINTNYKFTRLRLLSGPNPHVYPLKEKTGTMIYNSNDNFYMLQDVIADSVKIRQPFSGIIITPGNEGLYTFAIDIVCPDGTVVETLTRSFNVTATVPVTVAYPDLKYSNALTCASSGSDMKINMNASGGRWPYIYEFKSDTAANFQLTGNSGADSSVVITPAPAPGTVFDIRVTDACGNTSTNKVTVSSFTGEFFIYSYPSDCYNNPFNTRVGTSWIRGAYYTWRRNGVLVAEGYNIPYVNLTGVSVDSVTVDVNLYNCYTGSASRRIISPNPCSVVVLPVNSLALNGSRLTPYNVQLNWKAVNELQSIRYFELEKSIDGIQFNKTYKRWADEKPGEHSYVYNDPETALLVFYRLRIVSIDGKEFVTPVLRIENKKITKPQIAISPNPARDIISLSILSNKLKPYKAKIFNDMGQLVKEIAITPEENSSKKIDLSSLATGAYFLTLIDNWEIVASGKFIKQ